MIVYGSEPPTALDILPLPLHQRTNMDFDERTTAMKKLHEETRANIQDHVLATRLNAMKKERVFEEGDLVWVHLRKERFPQERNSKLEPEEMAFQAQHEIKTIYLIRQGNSLLEGEIDAIAIVIELDIISIIIIIISTIYTAISTAASRH
ncbi:hypothetical protein QYE76_002319 [Lolium multiflorum]|uniref:Uncharacterized protein n=1 Tax=Lolium multiflorum TaxID=4521 RepID=A0AAD8RMY8_LOLMU|nr:hypothetical protein QYE76_002319 [Lolium multiflorum]